MASSTLDSGRFGTIDESVEFNKEHPLSLDNLSEYVYDPGSGVSFAIPDDFFSRNIIIFENKSKEITIPEGFKYQPVALSLALYKTVDLAPLILRLNNCASARDFTMVRAKIFNPSELDFLLQLVNINTEKYEESKKNPVRLGTW